MMLSLDLQRQQLQHVGHLIGRSARGLLSSSLLASLSWTTPVAAAAAAAVHHPPLDVAPTSDTSIPGQNKASILPASNRAACGRSVPRCRGGQTLLLLQHPFFATDSAV
jgi:hypothetical protein